ncbi:MAG: divergent polysaccharide deacetylase family protein [Gammaproteobacteria bacterium]|nr:divergent polysaccharide deacetylase family protein [Gammaproteobacteria bacterium]MCG3145914.1 hypothetical protein [Gammaproteobacteria bacterium]
MTRSSTPLSQLARAVAWTGLLLGSGAAVAEDRADALPAIGIIIDDLGYSRHVGLRALALPGPIAYSVLPHTPAARMLAEKAHELGKDVLLHLPMEAMDGNRALGVGAIVNRMSREEVLRTVVDNLASVPHAIGVNNHMGSLLTAQRQPMQWVMEALRERGNLIYVDSRTTSRTVAGIAARAERLPFLSRDVFLDNEHGKDYARRQFYELVRRARRDGHALAIGHPREDTLRVLEGALPHLELQGVRLVRLPDLLALQQRSHASWQLSSSH